MCGRFTLTIPGQILAEHFQVPELADLQPRYNIAPTQTVAALRKNDDGRLELTRLRWGLIPLWAKDPSIGYKLINARGETVAEKPSFRGVQTAALPGAGGRVLRMAGGRGQEAALVVPRGPRRTVRVGWLVGVVAGRRRRDAGVLRADQAYSHWLDPTIKSVDELMTLVKPFEGTMAANPVGLRVNNARIDDVDCVLARS